MSATYVTAYEREQPITASIATTAQGWFPCSAFHTLRITYKVDAPTGSTTPRLELAPEFGVSQSQTSGDVARGTEVDFFDQADLVTMDVPVIAPFARLKHTVSGVGSWTTGVRVVGIA